jgi:uncharacterized protein (DUF427 family)
MRATWNGIVLADSSNSIEIDGYHYVPRAAVRMDLLRRAAKTQGDQSCPHGVQFYDVVDGERSSERQAWSYEAPRAAMQRVDGWIGFWDEVEVTT